jgi:5S rRNA maturation endonuclease (ribonuclease M5)
MPKLSKEQRKFLETTASQYAQHLDLAADWLAARQIDLEHARYEGLGVVVDPPALHAGYSGRLAIPYITDFGPVKMSFRCLKDHNCKESEISPDPLTGKPRFCSKYIRERGATTGLYGVRSFDDATDWIGVTEGELDSLILRQIGIPAIAIPGASNWEEHWPNVFEDLSRLYVFADADKAGEELFQRIRDRLKMPVIKVRLPKGEDVNSTYVKYGAQAILDRIKK